MARIKSFRAWRPVQTLADKIASRPYDVINSKEARKEVQNNPYSFLRIVKSEVDLPEDISLYDESVYDQAASNLDQFKSNGWLIQEKVPALYIYRQVLNNRSQTGVIAAQHIDDYLSGHVKIHELTRIDKEEDRIHHIDTVNANTGPVFYTYPSDRFIDSLVAKAMVGEPEYDFTDQDHVRHSLWTVVNSEMTEAFISAFARIPFVYVADGHHRSKASALIGDRRRKANPHHTGNEEYNWFLSVFFPENQLSIIDYNRVVKDLNGLSADSFLEKLEKVAHVEKKCCHYSAKPESQHEIACYLNNSWYKLTLKPDIINETDPVLSMDSHLLTQLVLEPILGIENLRSDKRIDFVGGSRGLLELQDQVDSGESAIAFALYPISLKQLMNVADTDQLMPPKTTWFEPKLQSGLIIHDLGCK